MPLFHLVLKQFWRQDSMFDRQSQFVQLRGFQWKSDRAVGACYVLGFIHFSSGSDFIMEIDLLSASITVMYVRPNTKNSILRGRISRYQPPPI